MVFDDTSGWVSSSRGKLYSEMAITTSPKRMARKRPACGCLSLQALKCAPAQSSYIMSVGIKNFESLVFRPK